MRCRYVIIFRHVVLPSAPRARSSDAGSSCAELEEKVGYSWEGKLLTESKYSKMRSLPANTPRRSRAADYLARRRYSLKVCTLVNLQVLPVLTRHSATCAG